MLAIDTPIGTRVGIETAFGVKEGSTLTEVDGILRRVMVSWDGEGEPRTEDTHEVFVLNPTPAAPPTPEQDLAEWWEELAHSEVSGLLQKMNEYGGTGRALDLIEIGRSLREAGVPAGPLTGSGQEQDGHLMELGIYFYLVGKLARWTAAVSEGRLVSDDTLHDIGIYVRMVQRIRARGGWPQ